MKNLLSPILFMFVFLGTTAAREKLNVILFLVDDLGYYDLSCTGSKLYETPNIDALAAAGMQFRHAYVAHPRCVPSRYAIQTGKFPARAKIPGGPGQMKVSEITIGEAFQEAGYKTFFAGKWHLGKKEEQWPHHQGYDINKGGCSAGAPISYFFPYNEAKGRNSGNHREIIGLGKGVAGEYITDRLTDETIAFIKDQKEQPFFAMLSHYAVHTPFQAKAELVKKYEQKLKGMIFEGPEYIQKDGTTKIRQDNAVYAAMIESMDESLGRLIHTLREEGLYENTAIIFTSDHGGLSNRGAESKRPLATSNLPLRAGKGHAYEGGLKVPFIVYWPGRIKASSVSDQVTVNTDIFPTLLDIARIPLKPGVHKDGISLLNALQGKKNEKRTLFWHSPLGRPASTGDKNCSAVRTGHFKLIDFYDEKKVEVYNLNKDPYEEKNLAEEKVQLTTRLHNKLNNWKNRIETVHKKK